MDNLTQIFESIRPLLNHYQPPLVSKVDDPAHFDLWSKKTLVIDGRKRAEVFFAALIIQKNYVGFYFMPVYVDAEIKGLFPPALLKLLKGKSCFHIKKLDAQILNDIETALRHGYELYQRRGWI